MEDSRGWIKYYRKVEDNFLFKEKPFCKLMAWIDLLSIVNHTDGTEQFDTGDEILTVKRGEIFRCAEFFRNRWGWNTLPVVRRFLKKLEKSGMVILKTHQKGIHLKVVNYDTYNTQRSPTVQSPFTDRSPTVQSPFTDRSGINNIKNLELKNEENLKNNNLVSAKPKHTKKFESSYSESFEIFWKEFPKDRKGSKSKAYDIWKSYGLDKSEMKWAFEKVMNDVIIKKEEDRQWLDGFAPMATTYLNGKQWETEIAQKTKNPYEGKLTKKGQAAMAWLKDV